jgi:hypothetical protein
MNKNFDTFLRWGMPGWSAIMGFLIFVLTDYFSANDSTMYDKINSAFASQGLWQLTVAALLVAGAGVPLGFIIYQIYFYLRWNSPVSEDGLLPPLVVGRRAELDDTLHTLKIKDLAFKEKWRDELLSEGEDHRTTWFYMDPFLVDTLIQADKDGTVYDRHSYLMNMLHTLGASHLGIVIGYVSYLLFKWRMEQSPLWWLVVAFGVILVVIILLSKEDLRNRNKKPNLFGMQIMYPAELFIASLVLVYLVNNPALNILFRYQLPWFICAGIALLWGISVKSGRRFLMVIFVFATICAYVIKFLIPPSIQINANWPVMLSILLFCILTLIFLKNRQNTREQLVTFEYYYVQKYIVDYQKSKKNQVSQTAK